MIRKERWGISWSGVFLCLLLACSTALLLVWNVQPFLAETHRVSTDTLVVEGWIHEYAIRDAVEEFKKGSYKRVFSTGGPVIGNGGYVNDYQTSANVGAGLLKEQGLSPDIVQMVPSHVLDRDRTYASAVALRVWLRQHDMNVSSLNVVTEGAHARRTRLMFEKALGKGVAVGIIAVPNPDYDQRRWWLYSDGVKEVGSEAFAYIYSRLLFHPLEKPFAENPNHLWQVSR
ncbi:MAG TPA: ElyC/SanA/YdcF family protein [Candidatus Udaeobacter sp.]|nr:ElyC/SanA/YdcF family protein [Candidatus Udaeobacter sp.]